MKAALEKEKNRPATTGATTIDLSGGIEEFAVDYAEGADVGYRWFERTGQQPLRPFGYGLSYTQFTYGKFSVHPGRETRLRFKVTNSGRRAGSDVPQVYAAVPGPDGKPIKRLVGFQRVVLAPGESRLVDLSVDPRLIGRYDVASRQWKVTKSRIRIILGRNAEDEVAARTITLPDIVLKP